MDIIVRIVDTPFLIKYIRGKIIFIIRKIKKIFFIFIVKMLDFTYFCRLMGIVFKVSVSR